MDRTRIVLVGVVALTVLALALGAPTLTELDQEEDGGDGAGEGSPGEADSEEGGDGFTLEPGESGGTGDQLSPTPLIVAGLLLLLIIGILLLYGIGPVKVMRVFVVVVVLFVVVMTLISGLGPIEIPNIVEDVFDFRHSGLGEDTGDGDDQTTGGDETGEESGSPTSIAVSVGTLLVLVIGTLFGVAVMYRYASEGEVEGEPVPEETMSAGGSVTAETLGRAAGRASENMTDTAADNGIYEAWVEMTAELEVDNRAVRTPGEFEQAAVTAGMEREHVEELTSLFEHARYGEMPVTREHEKQALETLERIEDVYAQGDDWEVSENE